MYLALGAELIPMVKVSCPCTGPSGTWQMYRESSLHLLPLAAVTKDHRLAYSTETYCLASWRLQVWDPGIARATLL